MPGDVAGHCGAIAGSARTRVIHQLELHVASAAEKHLNRDLREASSGPLRWALAILIQRHSITLAMTAGSAVVGTFLWLWG